MENLNTRQMMADYPSFAETSLSNRFIKHRDVLKLIDALPSKFKIEKVGSSVEQRSIQLIEWGNGPIKIFLWSQMHGDEATGTMALFDLINYLQLDIATVKGIQESCTLYILPMVNPDGAERHTRRNAQQIDINRDFLKTTSPEAKILKKIQSDIQPDFGFNLHDQLTLWSVSGSKRPATLSYLAPAFDERLSNSQGRTKAMQIIVDMYAGLNEFLPGQIGLFDDEHEPRAFGDNFQLNGTSTILIEAGGLLDDDEKQEIRKYYFLSILTALDSIASKRFKQRTLDEYFSIPKNNKQIFHFLIHGIKLDDVEVSIGINYEEKPNPDGTGTSKNYVVQDIGDLDILSAYKVFQDSEISVKGKIELYADANFDLLSGGSIILSFKNGKLESKV